MSRLLYRFGAGRTVRVLPGDLKEEILQGQIVLVEPEKRMTAVHYGAEDVFTDVAALLEAEGGGELAGGVLPDITLLEK